MKPPKALYAASLDPITNGHLSLIETASKMFEAGVIVLIASNPKKQGLFSPELRAEIVKQTLSHLPNVQVRVSSQEFTAKIAQKLGAKYLIRGIRNASDLEAERTLTHLNSQIAPDIQTIYLPASQSLEHISSSALKALMGYQGWIDLAYDLAPKQSVKALIKHQLEGEYHALTERSQIGAGNRWPDIVKAHEARAYHNLEHLLRSVEFAHTLKLSPENKDLLLWAIFFHDFVQNKISNSENVRASDIIFNAVTSVGATSFKAKVRELILATDYTKSASPSRLAKLMRDIDLTILASSPKVYVTYYKAIRQEYSQIPELQFQIGRTEFLKKMLNKKQIFATKEFHKFEAPARKNLEEELQMWHGRKAFHPKPKKAQETTDVCCKACHSPVKHLGVSYMMCPRHGKVGLDQVVLLPRQ
jgi:pantetheine-phosphate adenylyltransferase